MTTYTLEELAWVVYDEGLGYAISSYTDGSGIQDDHMRELWRKAREILHEIEEILDPYLP